MNGVLETPDTMTKFGEVDKENGLRVVIEGAGPLGNHVQLTKTNGDGTGQICLECTREPAEADSALTNYSDDLLTKAASQLGAAKPLFEFEAPVRWAVSPGGNLLKPGQANTGNFVFRQLFRFRL